MSYTRRRGGQVPEKAYLRLTRLQRRSGRFIQAVGTYSGLWLAEDHLLCVNSNRFMEDYKRFYFQDIQSITIVMTQRGRNWNFVLASLMLLTLTAAASLPDSRVFWLVVLGVFGFLVLLNNLLG